MENRIEKIISGLFHPVLIPSYMLVIFFNQSFYYSFLLPLKGKLILWGIVFFFTAIFPLIIIYFFLKRGWIKTLTMETREERIYPLFMTSVFYYITFYMLKQVQAFPVFSIFLFGSVILAVLTLLINFFWKISIHSVAIGGVLGAFLSLAVRYQMDNTLPIIITIIIAGLIGYARLKLNAHKPLQVYSGFLLGIIIMAVLFFML